MLTCVILHDATSQVAATRVSFSSYPGVLNSGDDFYVISSGLVQWETTIGNSNSKLAKQFISPLSILEWVRNIVANRLADDCLTWVRCNCYSPFFVYSGVYIYIHSLYIFFKNPPH